MPLVESNPKAETVGTAPKVAWITLAALAVAVLLAVVDKLLLDDEIPDDIWLTLLGSAPILFGIGYSAPAAVQRAKEPRNL